MAWLLAYVVIGVMHAESARHQVRFEDHALARHIYVSILFGWPLFLLWSAFGGKPK